jgi:hypothetical protein
MCGKKILLRDFFRKSGRRHKLNNSRTKKIDSFQVGIDLFRYIAVVAMT